MKGKQAGIVTDEERDRIVAFNRELESESVPFRLSEKLLDRSLHRLETLNVCGSAAYWLTYARITELALDCAGGYADAMEFQAAGDLLVNPRCVFVHVPAERRTVIKERHKPLTEQFGHVAPKRSSVVQWLKRNTVVQVSREALLPHMASRLRSCGVLSEGYLESVDERMRKLSDTLAFFVLKAESGDLQAPPEAMSHCEWAIRLQNQCGFDLQGFFALGEELEERLLYYSSRPMARATSSAISRSRSSVSRAARPSSSMVMQKGQAVASTAGVPSARP